MELTILNNCLFGSLKAWHINFEDDKQLKEILKKANAIQVSSYSDVMEKLNILLQPFPDLQKVVNQNKATTFNELSFTASTAAKPTDLLSNYYSAVITTEAIRYYNSVLANPLIKDKKLDVPFQIGTKVLKPLSVLIKQINDYLTDKDFTVTNPNNPTIVSFVFEALIQNLIPVYFSIQQHFKPYLTEIYETYEDFEMYVIENAGFKIQLNEINKEPVSIAKSNNMGFSFGFKGDEAKLKNLVLTLCNYKNFLDEKITKPEVLIDLLTAPDIYKKQYHIQFGCKSNLATYIVDSLKKKLPKFTYANIANSNYFFSSTGTPVNPSLFSNSKSNNPLNKKAKEEIDKIFKENDM